MCGLWVWSLCWICVDEPVASCLAEISKRIGVGDGTIKAAYRLMEPHVVTLLPSDFERSDPLLRSIAETAASAAATATA